MNEEQNAVCKMIIQELKAFPIWKLFSDSNIQQIPKEITKPLTFEMIESKLEHHVYKNSDAWVSEMRCFFMAEIENSLNSSLRHSSAVLLSQKFESLMETLAPGMSPYIISLQITENEVNKVYNSLQTLYPKVEINKSDKKPASRIIKEIESEDNFEVVPAEKLIHKIKLLKSPDAVLRAVAYLHKLQPECVVFEPLALRFILITKENSVKFNSFLNNLLYDIASGKFDLTNKVDGTKIVPVEIRSV